MRLRGDAGEGIVIVVADASGAPVGQAWGSHADEAVICRLYATTYALYGVHCRE